MRKDVHKIVHVACYICWQTLAFSIYSEPTHSNQGSYSNTVSYFRGKKSRNKFIVSVIKPTKRQMLSNLKHLPKNHKQISYRQENNLAVVNADIYCLHKRKVLAYKIRKNAV